MVDIHAHILPELDDGSDSMQTSLVMASQAVHHGIRHMVASSHGNLYNYTLKEYWECFDALRFALNEQKIPLKLYSGQEILLNERALELLRHKQLLPLNDTRYLMVEFPFDENQNQMIYLIEKILELKYIPILAHPERYYEIQRDLRLASYLRNMGCILQCNGGSILGRMGQYAARSVKQMLKEGIVDLFATDAHDTGFRSVEVKAFLNVLQKQYDSVKLHLWTSENPSRILKGMPVLQEKN